jgi:hypothetical protein
MNGKVKYNKAYRQARKLPLRRRYFGFRFVPYITDGFGSAISPFCPNGCGRTMQVVRPGQFQCYKCGE